MSKGRGLIVMVAGFFLIMGVNSNSVFAQEPPAGILDKLNNIESQIANVEVILNGTVIPDLDQIYQECCPECPECPPCSPCEAHVPRTGQTTSYRTGDDGYLRKGIVWPDPRFTDNEDGTVTDNMTGLIWLKDANCFGPKNWEQAVDACKDLADGSCGLTDSSIPGDWRLPNAKELQSLVNFGAYDPALPADHPFENVQLWRYWTSNTREDKTDDGWFVNMNRGNMNGNAKINTDYVWPVRGSD